MQRKSKQSLTNLALLVCTLGLSLILSEVVLRAIYPARESVSEESFYRHDSRLGWSKIPGRKGWIVHKEFEVFEEINSKGIRGPEYPFEKPPGEFRILVLGDSFTEGYTVGFEDLFSERLKSALNCRGDGRSYQVINAGTRAYSTDQELLYFEDEGRRYSPDLVVVMLCMNDIWYNIQSKYLHYEKPLFVLEGGELRLTNVPVPMPKISWRLGGRRDARFYDWLAANSRIWAFLAEKLERIPSLLPCQQATGKPTQFWERKAEELQDECRLRAPIPAEFLVWKRDRPAKAQYAWDVTEALLRRLRDRVREAGGKILVFHVPTRESIDPFYWEIAEAFHGISEAEWDVDRVADDLAEVCARQSVPFVEPTEIFKGEAARLIENDERLYNTYDMHWNKNGHALVGKILADYISRTFLDSGADETDAD